jgi:serine/threonine-protein kinase
MGHDTQGLAALERAAALTPDGTLFQAQLGQAYAMTGKVVEARDLLRKLHALARQRFVSPYLFVYVYAGLGEDEQAMDNLERAYELRSGPVYGIKGSFLFRSLRTHPRFIALLKKMNLA